MKKVFLSIFLVFAASVFSNVLCQGSPPGAGTPAGAGDKNLGDDSIKARSVEMERVKQDAEKIETASVAPINKKIVSKFPEIKEDFEGIQIVDDAINKAYTKGKTINYVEIATFANEINKKSRRLDANIFAAKSENKDNKSDGVAEKAKSIRDLIVELDTAIGSFVSSKIFANLNVIEPEVAIKTRADLLAIIELSEKLSISAKELM